MNTSKIIIVMLLVSNLHAITDEQNNQMHLEIQVPYRTSNWLRWANNRHDLEMLQKIKKIQRLSTDATQEDQERKKSSTENYEKVERN
jgi:hypothetical protein